MQQNISGILAGMLKESELAEAWMYNTMRISKHAHGGSDALQN